MAGSAGVSEKQSLNLKTFEAFYQEAQVRDKAMTANLLGAMQTHRAKTAVLVTGGFHGPGINRHLTEAGVTVVTFVPKITKADEAAMLVDPAARLGENGVYAKADR